MSTPKPDRPQNTSAQATAHLITVGRLSIDLLARRAELNGRLVHLSPHEFDLLAYWPAALAAPFPVTSCGGRSGIVIRRAELLTKSGVVSSAFGRESSLTPSTLAMCWVFAGMAI